MSEEQAPYDVSYIADNPENITFGDPEPWNVQTFRKIAEEMVKTYIAKNHDYGDSFSKSIGEWGPVAGLVRIQDKFNRAKNLLMKCAETSSHVDEAVSDTLLDLANYAIMLRMAMIDIKPVDFENVE